MNSNLLRTFLRDNVEPLEDSAYGKGYRVSAYLTDNTFLPCVIFRNVNNIVDLAIRRFEEEKNGFFRKTKLGLEYRDIVKTFVAHGNCINDYDISRIELSKYAIPKKLLNQIQGETTMSWTGFALKMKDGKYFGFGTKYLFEFFDLPGGYSFEDVVEVINHSYISKNNELRKHKVPFVDWPNDYNEKRVFREKPYFECYIEEL